MSKTAQISLEIGYSLECLVNGAREEALMFSQAVTQWRNKDNNRGSISLVFLATNCTLRDIGRSVD
jgi:hypothetical protein